MEGEVQRERRSDGAVRGQTEIRGRRGRGGIGMLLAGWGRGRLRLLWGTGHFMLSVVCDAAADGRVMGMARMLGRGPQAGKGWAMNDSPTTGLAHEWWARRRERR
jgi:hypothetical protein